MRPASKAANEVSGAIRRAQRAGLDQDVWLLDFAHNSEEVLRLLLMTMVDDPLQFLR